MRSVLVTGGTGFIGQPLINTLLDLGYEVIVLTRNANRDARVNHLSYIQSLDQLAADTPIDIIINLAGEPLAAGRWNKQRKQQFIDSRVETTRNIRQLVERLNVRPKTLLNGSAIGWYGPHDDAILAEDGHARACFSHDLCDAWEQEATSIAQLGLRVCLLRIGIVLGRNGGPLEEFIRPLKLGVRATLGDGNQYLSWIHLDDMLGLIAHLIQREDINGVVNCTAPKPVTQREFTDIASANFRTWLSLPIPKELLRLMIGEMAIEILVTGQRVVPAKALDAGYLFKYPTLGEALAELLAPQRL